MIEIQWGHPLSLVVTSGGEIQDFTTIEQARYWLCKKWPVADGRRNLALERIDAAMHCLGTVGAAREAFLSAARSAGFRRQVTADEDKKHKAFPSIISGARVRKSDMDRLLETKSRSLP